MSLRLWQAACCPEKHWMEIWFCFLRCSLFLSFWDVSSSWRHFLFFVLHSAKAGPVVLVCFCLNLCKHKMAASSTKNFYSQSSQTMDKIQNLIWFPGWSLLIMLDIICSLIWETRWVDFYFTCIQFSLYGFLFFDEGISLWRAERLQWGTTETKMMKYSFILLHWWLYNVIQ